VVARDGKIGRRPASDLLPHLSSCKGAVYK
jgi:hypothetical protein